MRSQNFRSLALNLAAWYSPALLQFQRLHLYYENIVGTIVESNLPSLRNNSLPPTFS